MKREAAPPLAAWLLGILLSQEDRDAVLGDLEEEYALRRRVVSAAGGRAWYWSQVCRSIFPVLRLSARRGRWASTLAVALGAYVAVGLIESSAVAVLARVLRLNARADVVLNLIVGLVTIALAGHVAARIRPGAAHALAAVMIIGVAVMMVVVTPGSVPLWYALAFLVGAPMASLAGGTFCRRRREGNI